MGTCPLSFLLAYTRAYRSTFVDQDFPLPPTYLDHHHASMHTLRRRYLHCISAQQPSRPKKFSVVKSAQEVLSCRFCPRMTSNTTEHTDQSVATEHAQPLQRSSFYDFPFAFQPLPAALAEGANARPSPAATTRPGMLSTTRPGKLSTPSQLLPTMALHV